MIKLVTDTSANLPADLINRYAITIIPFSYSINGKEVVGGSDDFDGKAFYDAMRSGAEVKTSMINVSQFEKAFSMMLEEGNDVLYIAMSGGISGTANAAAIAAKELEGKYPDRKILVINSLAASMGEGLLVLEAAKMIEENKSFDEIGEQILKLKETMCQFFTVDDLQYLKRGGRITGATAFIGTVLQIKPLLKGDEMGRIVPCGKVRGRKNSLLALAEKYDLLAADKSATISIAHGDCEEDALELIDMLKQKGFCGQCINVCYEPVTGSHVGPGTVALFYPGIHK